MGISRRSRQTWWLLLTLKYRYNRYMIKSMTSIIVPVFCGGHKWASVRCGKLAANECWKHLPTRAHTYKLATHVVFASLFPCLASLFIFYFILHDTLKLAQKWSWCISFHLSGQRIRLVVRGPGNCFDIYIEVKVS